MQAEGSDSNSSEDELTTYVNRDGTHSSATAAELKLAAALSKDPWGRFGGRAGKLARIRAQEAATLAAMQVTPQARHVHVCSGALLPAAAQWLATHAFIGSLSPFEARAGRLARIQA